MLFLRDGVEAAAVERVATEDTTHGQAAARGGPVPPDRFFRVRAAAGQVSAEAAD
jgi:hypothetical protein